MVLSIGADHVIDYKKEDYTQKSQKYDLIVDMIGNHSLSKNRRVLNPAGTLVIVGGTTGNWLGPLAAPLKTMGYSPFVEQKFVMLLAQMRKDDLAVIGDLIEAGAITPVIDTHYALHDVPAAIDYSESGHARGKIIINID